MTENMNFMNFSIETGEKVQFAHVFDDGKRVTGIAFLTNHFGYLLCHSSSKALICFMHDDETIQIDRHLLNVASIKSNLASLSIKRISFCIVTNDNNRLLIAILLNDDSVYIYKSSETVLCPSKIELIKHIHPAEHCEVYSNGNNNNNNSSNEQIKSSNGFICDMKFSNDGSELWFTTVESHVMIIDTQRWNTCTSISIEKFFVSKLFRLSSEYVERVLKQSIANSWIGKSNRSKIVFLYEKSKATVECEVISAWKCLEVKRLAVSRDGSKLASSFADGKLRIYSVDILLKQSIQPAVSSVDSINTEFSQNIWNFDKKVRRKI